MLIQCPGLTEAQESGGAGPKQRPGLLHSAVSWSLALYDSGWDGSSGFCILLCPPGLSSGRPCQVELGSFGGEGEPKLSSAGQPAAVWVVLRVSLCFSSSRVSSQSKIKKWSPLPVLQWERRVQGTVFKRQGEPLG